MKRRVLKIALALTGIIVAFILYLNSSYYIQNQTWKYRNGTYIGDWFAEGNLKVKDGIIYGNRGNAKFVFCFGFGLVIKNIETGERGIYVNKS